MNQELVASKVEQWAKAAVPVSVILSGASGYGKGVYIVFKDSRPVYVGETKRTLRDRIMGHMTKTGQRQSLLGEYLAQGLKGYSAIAIDDDRFTEPLLIKALRPEFNRAGLQSMELTGAAKAALEEARQHDQEAAKRYEAYSRYFWSIMHEVDGVLRVYRNKAFPVVNEFFENGIPLDEARKKAFSILCDEIGGLEAELKAKSMGHVECNEVNE